MAHVQFQILSFLVVLSSVGSTFGVKIPHPNYYGRPCTNETYPPEEDHRVHCNLDQNMYCSEKGICECIIGERGRVFAHHDRTCIEVSSVENTFACTEDIQCTLSSYGRHSRCNRAYDRCECFHETEKTVLQENQCYIHLEPRALKSSPGFQGCSEDDDCTLSLGELSRCNKADSTCECYDTKSSGKKDVKFYQGTCVAAARLGGFCNSDDECRAGFHHNAFCGPHEGYLPQEKICQCPQGKRCDGDSGALSYRSDAHSLPMIILSTVMMGVVAKVLG